MTHEIKMVSAKVGFRSLVGINTNNPPPYSFGNYFSLATGETFAGLRVFNFWAENLAEAARQFLTDGLVQVRVWEWEVDGRKIEACLIDDPRIPADWYHNTMCFTGFGRPPKDVAVEMYTIKGDPTNELEYWGDPEMYYARRGQRWMGNGVVSWCAGDSTEQLMADLEAKRKEK